MRRPSDTLLATAHVRRTHLFRQLRRFVIQLGLARGKLCIQFRLAPRRIIPLALEVLETGAFLGNLDLSLLQLVRQAVTRGRALVHALLEIGDAVADFFELLFLDLGELAPGFLSLR
jgi:hypothetical protein